MDGAALDANQARQSQAPAHAAAGDEHAAASGVTAPAATRHLSTEALLHALLTLLDGKQPEQARALLQGIAQQLRDAAVNDNALEPGLQSWVARFEHAAQSGDVASLLPSTTPATHFGLRAYQAAGQVVTDSRVVDEIVSHVLAGTQPEAQVAIDAARMETIGRAPPPEMAGAGALRAEVMSQVLARELPSPQQLSAGALRAEGLPLPAADGGAVDMTLARELAAFLAGRSLQRIGKAAERVRRRRARHARRRWRRPR